ncbi:MAG TPA: hypothetical protein VF733_05335 [Candidatus Saccharimonadales bacterium]
MLSGYPKHDLYGRHHPDLLKKVEGWLDTPEGDNLLQELQPLSEALRREVVPPQYQGRVFQLDHEFSSVQLERLGVASNIIGVALRRNLLETTENEEYITLVNPRRFIVPEELGERVLLLAKGNKLPLVDPSDCAGLALAVAATVPRTPPRLQFVPRYTFASCASLPLPRL